MGVKELSELNEQCKYKFKRAEIKTGLGVVLLEPVQNGEIRFDALERGRIVYHQNQVEASIWFRGNSSYATDRLVRKLGVEINPINGRFEGVVLDVKSKSFAVQYRFNDHDDITVDEEKALHVPFFKVDESKRLVSPYQRDMFAYHLSCVADSAEDGFAKWVEQHMKTQKVTKREKENGDYPFDWDRRLTDYSTELFFTEKGELELAFAKATGVWREFTGGMILE